MECPFCKHADRRVMDSRHSRGTVRRRSECLKCGKRYTTYETCTEESAVVALAAMQSELMHVEASIKRREAELVLREQALAKRLAAMQTLHNAMQATREQVQEEARRKRRGRATELEDTLPNWAFDSYDDDGILIAPPTTNGRRRTKQYA